MQRKSSWGACLEGPPVLHSPELRELGLPAGVSTALQQSLHVIIWNAPGGPFPLLLCLWIFLEGSLGHEKMSDHLIRQCLDPRMLSAACWVHCGLELTRLLNCGFSHRFQILCPCRELSSLKDWTSSSRGLFKRPPHWKDQADNQGLLQPDFACHPQFWVAGVSVDMLGGGVSVAQNTETKFPPVQLSLWMYFESPRGDTVSDFPNLFVPNVPWTHLENSVDGSFPRDIYLFLGVEGVEFSLGFGEPAASISRQTRF